MGLLPWQSPWRGLLFCRLRVSREAQRPRFYRITMKMSWDLKPWTHVFNSLFSTNGSCKQVRKLYLERICLDGSSQNLPSALATVSEQYLSSPYATEEVIEGGVIISKKPLLLIILGPSDSQSLKACEPTNQRINFSLLRCIKKVVAFHTLHLPDSHSPFLHPWWRCLWKTSLTFPKASLNLVFFVADLNRPPPRLGQRAKGSKAAPQRNDVEKDNAKLAILVEMELSYL